MPLTPGTRLGPYEIVSPLGKGGMGEVYKGTDTRLGRHVAIKVVAEALSADPQYRQRLEREARTISRLQHPNICTLHDIGSAGESQYLVMEFLEGETLGDRLRTGPLTVGEALRIGREIAAAVEAAHRNGVVHRDLKPGNVMLGPAGTKVLDFGLARVATTEPPPSVASTLPTLTEPITEEGRITGTMPYMAPEQLEGGRPDPRTDIWALGCILYEMATGKRPFQGDSKPALISSIMAREPVPMAELEAGLPPRLAWVVERCLKKDPDERWQSARDLAIELGAVSRESGPVPVAAGGARAAALASAPKATASGRRWSSAAAVVGGALLIAGLAAGFFLFRPAPPEPIAAEGAAVAVLPFENLTGNDQLDYIGLGLAAGLISELSELTSLTVVGRSRAWRAHADLGNPAEIAETLGVNLIVEGEVRLSEGTFHLDVNALDGMTAGVIWSKGFAGTRDALFELQQRVARSVARVLSVPLSEDARRRLARAGPSAKAFDYYLQGVERVEQRANPRHFEFAADLFRQAIRIDPQVAIFHAALSNALSQSYLEGNGPDRSEEAEDEARKALELDAWLPEAHLALARALRSQGRYAESVAELRPVLAAHPKPGDAFLELALGYELTGDNEAALEALQTAVALEPESWFHRNALGVTQAEFGDFEGAGETLKEALELAPQSVNWPRLNLGGVKIVLGDYEGAISDFEATGATTSNPELASNLATAYYFTGDLEKAEGLYRRAVSLDPTNYVLSRNLGDALSELGREDEAVAAYTRALALVEEGLAERPQSDDLLRSRALYAAKIGDCNNAAAHARAARPILSENWKGQLDLAMTFALCGLQEEALESIRASIALGLPGHMIRGRAEFAALAENETFKSLTEG